MTLFASQIQMMTDVMNTLTIFSRQSLTTTTVVQDVVKNLGENIDHLS